LGTRELGDGIMEMRQRLRKKPQIERMKSASKERKEKREKRG
jgi:hypothetical protein